MREHEKLPLRPGGLEILSTGLNLAELDLHGGQGLWDEVQRYAGNSLIERQLDQAMGGRAAPRVWAFLEAPAGGPGAAAAGLAAAWLLASRGQAVILVDADEQDPLITRWLGRIEREGWIDIIRFGASLHAASEPLPSDNRRGSILGVGSFTPTGVTPDEVAEFLNRLRRQADDLILVLPAKLRSVPWLETAQIRLLCWDMLGRSVGDTEKILAELDRMGARPDALLGYGVEEYTAIQATLREDTPPAVAATADDTTTAEPPSPETVVEEPAAAATTAQSVPAESQSEDAAAAGTQETEAAPSIPPRPRRQTSGVFVFVAAAAVVCLALLGLFLREQRTTDRRAAGQDPAVAAADRGLATPRPEAPAGLADEPDVVADQTANAAESASAAAAPTSEPPASAVVRTTPAQNEPVPAGNGAQPAGAGSAAVAAADVEAAASEQAVDWSAFRKTAGADGWTLWLYTLFDEQSAAGEVQRLGRRRIQAEYRAVELPGKGRVFRIYAGSFASRREADAAKAHILAELKHNWAMAQRF